MEAPNVQDPSQSRVAHPRRHTHPAGRHVHLPRRAELLGAFGGTGDPAFVVWGAGPIELLGGALMAAGLFTRIASFLTSGLMAAAYFIAHAPQGFWPILNGGELAITFCWLSLYLAAHGPGAWAVDNLRSRVPAGQARAA
jgi:putative oxidoreductase